ncbi:DUF222 domain-containing protein [Georgenia wutianyii]|uniref:DUF222 domain-containing protein n=2 Tax=Georgenia wutianyii TaxID=2585135 RepID=A0ABX5VNR2_9MICO|nr:DUF222 domain-containing protein [Georgenia wutianyii]
MIGGEPREVSRMGAPAPIAVGELLPADPAEPPPWLVDDDGPAELAPLPPDPLGPDPFAGDADSVGAVRLTQAPPSAGPHGISGSAAALADLLATVAPGPQLAGALEATDPRGLDLYDLVEVIAGYHRLASWAHARLTELTGRLTRRPGINPHHPLPGGRFAADAAAAELAPRLGIPRRTARRIVGNAALFRDTLDQTADALRLGHLDPVKADTLARLLGDQPADVAWEVQRQVLPAAPHQTANQLSRAVQRALVAVDPHRATQRHRAARETRRVDHPRPLPDGMAALYAVLPATDAAGLDLALEAAARGAKAGGDTRTIDQLRADALALLGHTALDQGFIGLPEKPGQERVADDGVPCTPHAATGAEDLQPVSDYLRMLRMPVGTIGGRRAQIRVTVPLSALVLPTTAQGGLANPGECPDHLAEGLTEPPGNSSAHLGTERTGPPGTAHNPPRTTRSESFVPSTGAHGLPGPSPDDDGPTPAEVAELDGYGPITPDVARALALSGGTWQRLVTDPLSGRLLDVGRTRYRPPAAIAELVRARDRTCVVPGCSTPAAGCDLDHVVPYPQGPTSALNLAALCPADHTLKTLGSFRLRRTGQGTFEWTTPSGHRYHRDQNGRVTWRRPDSATSAVATLTGPPF